MSQFNYTKKPDWSADGAIARASAANYVSPMGWVSPQLAGQKTITAMTWLGGVVTVTATAHGLVSNQFIIVTGVTPVAYNGYVQVTVTDANTFTYPLASNPGAVTVQGKAAKMYEVVAAISSLDVVNADAIVVPTFTAAVSYPDGTSSVTIGQRIRVTLTAAEPVEVSNTPKIQLTVGAGLIRQLSYVNAASTSTSLVFEYTTATGDASSAGQVIVAAATNAGYVADVLPKSKRQIATVTFTAPNTSTTTIA